MQKWCITGANGNLGRNLLCRLLQQGDAVTAVVRSDRALQQIHSVALTEAERARLTTAVVDYTDALSLEPILRQATHIVHLVGILKETASASYRAAHEGSTQALIDALAGATPHVTYVSIIGSNPRSPNACLASKGRAAALLHAAHVPCCELRVPMVLGVGDYASFALRKRASQRLSFGFRMASQEQPIYANDVVDAIVQAGHLGVRDALDLGGPEVLTRAQLTLRAAQVLGTHTRPISLPLWLGLAFASFLERLPNPPVTRAMLEVLDHDDAVDPETALQKLQLPSLTPLNEMLAQVLRESTEPR